MENRILERTAKRIGGYKMSMENLNKALKLIESNFSRDEVLINGPVKEEVILKAEDALGVKFPNTYKKFLQNFGSGCVGSDYFYGLGKQDFDFTSSIPEVTAYHVVWSNLYDQKLGYIPSHLITIYNVGNGEAYCLDISKMNNKECPVVAWSIGVCKQKKELEVIAPDFGTFLLNCVQDQIAYKF
jgi:hypothetical protein